MSEDKITLKDVYAIVNRIEDKFDRKMDDFEDRLGANEGKLNNLLGKIAILTLIISSIMSIATAIIIKSL